MRLTCEKWATLFLKVYLLRYFITLMTTDLSMQLVAGDSVTQLGSLDFSQRCIAWHIQPTGASLAAGGLRLCKCQAGETQRDNPGFPSPSCQKRTLGMRMELYPAKCPANNIPSALASQLRWVMTKAVLLCGFGLHCLSTGSWRANRAARRCSYTPRRAQVPTLLCLSGFVTLGGVGYGRL